MFETLKNKLERFVEVVSGSVIILAHLFQLIYEQHQFILNINPHTLMSLKYIGSNLLTAIFYYMDWSMIVH